NCVAKMRTTTDATNTIACASGIPYIACRPPQAPRDCAFAGFGAKLKHDRARRERTSLMKRAGWLGKICAVALLGGLAGAAAAAPADFIHAEGTRLVDGRGDTFAVKGINLGNWLVPEGYMFKFKHALSPSEIHGLFESLLGAQAAAQFWSRFRDVYIAK